MIVLKSFDLLFKKNCSLTSNVFLARLNVKYKEISLILKSEFNSNFNFCEKFVVFGAFISYSLTLYVHEVNW